MFERMWDDHKDLLIMGASDLAMKEFIDNIYDPSKPIRNNLYRSHTVSLRTLGARRYIGAILERNGREGIVIAVMKEICLHFKECDTGKMNVLRTTYQS